MSYALQLLPGLLFSLIPASSLQILSPVDQQKSVSSPVFVSYVDYPQNFFFANVSVLDAGFISKCHLEQIPYPQLSSEDDSAGQILYFSDSNCFPEDIAFLAFQRGFIGVIKKSSFVVPGISAVMNWKKDNAPIPMLLVGKRETPEKWERIDFFPTPNWMLEQPVKGLLIFVLVLQSLVISAQFVVCLFIFHAVRNQIRTVKWYRNVPLILSLITCTLCIGGVMELVDYIGLWHRTNAPFKSWVSTLNLECSIWMNLILGFSLYNAIAEARSETFLGTIPRIIMLSWCLLTLIIDLTASYYTQVGLEQEQLVAARIFFYFVVLSVSTVFFYRSKNNVLTLFASTKGISLDKKTRLKISTTFLHINSFFSAAFLVCALLYAVLVILGNNWILCCDTLGGLSLRISSFFQILSESPLPSKSLFLTRSVNQSKRGSAASRGGDKQVLPIKEPTTVPTKPMTTTEVSDNL